MNLITARLIGVQTRDSRVRVIFGNHSSVFTVTAEDTPDGTTRVSEPIVSFSGERPFKPFLTKESMYVAETNGGNLFDEKTSKFTL